MANIISIVSSNNNSGKSTIAFNLINIMPSNLKILLIELDYTSAFWKLKDNKNKLGNIKRVSYGSPFGIYEYSSNINIVSPIKKSLIDKQFEELIKTNITSWKKTYDIVIFDSNSGWSQLLNMGLSFSNSVILIYDAGSFVGNKIIDDFKLIRGIQLDNKNLKLKNVIINNYDEFNTSHLNNLLQIKNVFAMQNISTTLPLVPELYPINMNTLDYAKKTPWSKYAVSLMEIVNKIID